jgi:hypothetical protein
MGMTTTTTSVSLRSPATRVRGRAAPSPDPLEKLRSFLDTHRMKEKLGPHGFAAFEKELHERVMEVERDLIAAEMKRFDVDADAVVIAGRVHRRVLRQSQTYMTSAGEVVVERTLYKDRKDGQSRCVSPMELTIGVIGDFWTPRAAQQALWVVTQMTPKKAQELFERVGNMDPSKSSLDRLPKLVAETWEGKREQLEEALRGALVIPEGTTSIAISLDGVLAPMEGTEVTQRRADAAHEERTTKGPLGYREVGCGTISFCDEAGEMLGAIRLGRAPETKKKTLKSMLAREVAWILERRPELRVVKIADAVKDNWEFLSGALPPGEEAIDFFHASGYLHAAVEAVYGEATRETTYRYETLREALRDEDGGVEKVIRALKHLAAKRPGDEAIETALRYFRTNRRRMQYARLTGLGLPIGSGAVEAACKTLVTQRLKNSGMRWSTAGAQAILTPRGWDQSDRFDEAWALVAAEAHAEVTVLANVIALKPKSEPRRRASR